MTEKYNHGDLKRELQEKLKDKDFQEEIYREARKEGFSLEKLFRDNRGSQKEKIPSIL